MDGSDCYDVLRSAPIVYTFSDMFAHMFSDMFRVTQFRVTQFSGEEFLGFVTR